MPPTSFAGAIKKALPFWDPSKHPRDRDGQFIETGSLVRAYTGPGVIEPETTGRVMASWYDQATNRMFIGVESGGKLHWYRPKQLERIKSKATLTPGKPPPIPLPALDEKADSVSYTGPGAPMGVVPASVIQKVELGETDANDFDIGLSDLPSAFKTESGLAEAVKPQPTEQPPEITIPAGKTPDDILDLVQTTFINKHVKGGLTAPTVQDLQKFDDLWEKFKVNEDFESAAKQLNTLMTLAKLGGKQRKRYKAVLAMKFGGHQAAEVVEAPAAPEPVPLLPEQVNVLSEGFDPKAWLAGNGYNGNPEQYMVYGEGPNELWVVLPTSEVDHWYVADGEWKGDFGQGISPDVLSESAVDGQMTLLHGADEPAAEPLDATFTNPLSENFDIPGWLKAHGYTGDPNEYEIYADNEPPHDIWVAKAPMGEIDHWSPAGEAYWADGTVKYEKLEGTGATHEELSDLAVEGNIAMIHQPEEEADYGPEFDQAVHEHLMAEAETQQATEADVEGWLDFLEQHNFAPDKAHYKVFEMPQTGAHFVAEVGADIVWKVENGQTDFLSDHDLETLEIGASNGSLKFQFDSVGDVLSLGPGSVAEPEPELEPEPEPEPALPVSTKPADVYVGSGESLYFHPQGSLIVANHDMQAVLKVGPDGKPKKSSATYDKITGGHGAWQYVNDGPGMSLALLEGTGLATPAKKATKKIPSKTAPGGSKTVTAKKTSASAPDGAVIQEAQKVLGLLQTTLENKGLSDVTTDSWWVALANAQSYTIALPHLNKLMTHAKLGGKQRKRYKDALAKKYGIEPEQIQPKMTAPGSPTAKLPPGSTPNNWPAVKPGGGFSGATKDTISPQQANALVNPNGMTPQQAKGSIQKQLSDRIKSRITTDQLVDLALNSNYQWGGAVKQLATAVKNKTPIKTTNSYGNWIVQQGTPKDPPGVTEDRLRETVINAMIHCWAASSNDNNPLTLGLQLAAIDEFGLTDTYPWPTGKKAAAEEYARHGELFRAYLRVMYENTQAWAKANGVKNVRLKRGMKTKKHGHGVVNVKLRPMSSFSSNTSTASGFSGGGIVYEAVVPIEWVVGTAATGFGCKNEYEWVVLGGIHPMKG